MIAAGSRLRIRFCSLSLFGLLSACSSSSNDAPDTGQQTGGSGATGAVSDATPANTVSDATPAGTVSDATPAGTVSDTTPASAADLLVPAEGALLGTFVGAGTVEDVETLITRRVAIHHNFFAWSDDFTTQAAVDLTAGRIPLITWEAWRNGVGTPLDEIISGAHDAMIQARADGVKALGKKIFLRWGHEMNGDWYPWGGAKNGANAAAAAKYIAAYRHIHDVFTAAGVTNALWVFSPNNASSPNEVWNQWSNYYPGDGYVDWMGIDGYNWGTTQTWSSFASFASLFQALYPGVAAKGKPVMIPETSAAEVGGDKAAWITAILPTLQTKFPAVKAFVWFHMNKETDWRIDSSVASKDAFTKLVNDSYFNP